MPYRSVASLATGVLVGLVIETAAPNSLIRRGFNTNSLAASPALIEKVRTGVIDGILQTTTAYGPRWLVPTQIVEGRLFQFGAQFTV